MSRKSVLLALVLGIACGCQAPPGAKLRADLMKQEYLPRGEDERFTDELAPACLETCVRPGMSVTEAKQNLEAAGFRCYLSEDGKRLSAYAGAPMTRLEQGQAYAATLMMFGTMGMIQVVPYLGDYLDQQFFLFCQSLEIDAEITGGAIAAVRIKRIYRGP